MTNNGPTCVAVINMKGGVGKTTISSLLARYAAQRRNMNTLAIDLDPQANLSQVLMGANSYRSFIRSETPSVVEVFAGYVPPTASNPSPSTLNIPNAVYGVSPNLRLIPSRFDFSDNLVNAVKPDPRIIARLIASDFQDTDLVIIDCAPTESVFTQAAYHASRHILVPVKPEFLATIGFPLLSRSLRNFENVNPTHDIDVAGVVINDTFDYQSAHAPEKLTALREIREESQRNNWYVFRNQLEYSRGFPKMMRGNYSQLGKAPDIFRRFAEELFRRFI